MSRRTDAVRRIVGWFLRGALLTLWALVGWGTLLLLATTLGSLKDGPAVALGRLLPSPGASIWTWLNVLSSGLAVGVWLIVLGVFLWDRWERRAPVEQSEPEG